MNKRMAADLLNASLDTTRSDLSNLSLKVVTPYMSLD